MGVAQLVEPWIVIPVVVGSSPIIHPIFLLYRFLRYTQNQPLHYWYEGLVSSTRARVAELVDALDLGSSGVTRESSSLSFRTIFILSGAKYHLSSS